MPQDLEKTNDCEVDTDVCELIWVDGVALQDLENCVDLTADMCTDVGRLTRREGVVLQDLENISDADCKLLEVSWLRWKEVEYRKLFEKKEEDECALDSAGKGID